jgi:hypothetical protein
MKHPSPRGAERRQFGRRNTICHAIACARGRPNWPCVVRNVSAGGAMVEIQGSVPLPTRFRLVVSAWQFEAECEVVHRSENAVGVRFLSCAGEPPWQAPDNGEAPGDPPTQLAQR